jgi:hypothetical protein
VAGVSFTTPVKGGTIANQTSSHESRRDGVDGHLPIALQEIATAILRLSSFIQQNNLLVHSPMKLC